MTHSEAHGPTRDFDSLCRRLYRPRVIDEREPVELTDDVGHGKCLAGTGHAEQGLVLVAGLDRLQEFRNRLGLVASRLVI